MRGLARVRVAFREGARFPPKICFFSKQFFFFLLQNSKLKNLIRDTHTTTQARRGRVVAAFERGLRDASLSGPRADAGMDQPWRGVSPF